MPEVVVENGSRRRKGRLTMLLLVAVCAGPVVLSWALVRNAGNMSFSDASHGELVSPAIGLPDRELEPYAGAGGEGRLRGKWFLLYWAGDACAGECQRKLEHMERIRQALGKESHRLRPLLYSVAPAPSGLRYGGEDSLWLWPRQSSGDGPLGLAGSDARLGRAGHYYLIDPLGNLFMSYSPEVNPVGIIKDIRRLMRASRAG